MVKTICNYPSANRLLTILLTLCLVTIVTISSSSFGLNFGSLSSLKSNNQKHPTADQAFTLDAFIKDENEIQLLISAIPNTYIYQNSFQFSTDSPDVTLHTAQYPTAKKIIDEHYGETQIFSDSFEVIIPYQSSASKDFNLTVQFQGCLKDVICYPPKEKVFPLTAIYSSQDVTPKLEPIYAPSESIKEQNRVNKILSTGNIFEIIATFFVIGLVLSLTPCVLPMLPIITGIIAGHKHNMTKLHAFMLSFVYVLSMALTYMLAGILVALAGVNLVSSMQHPAVLIGIAALFTFLAIASFGFIELRLPSFITQKLNNVQQHQKGGTYAGVAIMGILATLVISPCITPALAATLTYIASTGNAWIGGSALFTMGFAMGIPVLLFNTSAGHYLPKAGPWMKEINIFFGVVFIGIAIYLLSSIIPGPMTLILSAFLLIFYAVHLGLLEPAAHGWQRIQKGFALIMAIYGGFLLAGATKNQNDVLHPLGIVNYANTASITEHPKTTASINYIEFTKVKNYQDLKNNLEQASKNNQYTLLDFYADWCTSCRNLEKNVFTDPKVSKLLDKFLRLKVDLSHYSSEDKKLMAKLAVFNPPTMIFYDKKGNEIKNTRIVGEIDAEDFNKVLQSIYNEI